MKPKEIAGVCEENSGEQTLIFGQQKGQNQPDNIDPQASNQRILKMGRHFQMIIR